MKIFIKNQEGVEKELDAQVVDLKPNDVIVIKLPFMDDIPQKELKHCIDGFKGIFPNNKIVFIKEDSDLSIIRQGGNINETL